MGLVPGLIAPTANLNTTAACALIVFFYYHCIGVRKQGFVALPQALRGPGAAALKPLMFPIEVISHLRPAAVPVAPALRQHVRRATSCSPSSSS